MQINHVSPAPIASARKKSTREQNISAGMQWGGNAWQTRPADRVNIAGRAAKLNSLVTLGRAQLTDSSYTDASGQLRPLVWRTADDQNIAFTIQTFLEFAIAVDEFVEQKYFESWGV